MNSFLLPTTLLITATLVIIVYAISKIKAVRAQQGSEVTHGFLLAKNLQKLIMLIQQHRGIKQCRVSR